MLTNHWLKSFGATSPKPAGQQGTNNRNFSGYIAYSSAHFNFLEAYGLLRILSPTVTCVYQVTTENARGTVFSAINTPQFIFARLCSTPLLYKNDSTLKTLLHIEHQQVPRQSELMETLMSSLHTHRPTLIPFSGSTAGVSITTVEHQEHCSPTSSLKSSDHFVDQDSVS